MYEDSWYSFVPEVAQKKNAAQSHGHKRRESLLQQPNGTSQTDIVEPLDQLLEESQNPNEPPEATVVRRAKSYTDFYHVVRAHLSKHTTTKKRRKEWKSRKRDLTNIEALIIEGAERALTARQSPTRGRLEEDLLVASQQEFLLYRDQLALTERHLDILIEDTNSTSKLLATLAEAFRAVELQTSSFQAQCDDVLAEQRRLEKLADEVGTDLHYYQYLDGVTRRLNAPGASRLVDHEDFSEILGNLDACIGFMTKHSSYRDAESYLARYQSLLTKALHLLELGFTNHLDKVSSEISKQIVDAKSEAARHALAYGRFQELVLEADGLILNIQKVIRSCYDQLGNPVNGLNYDYYSNTTTSIFSSYLDVRDRDLKPVAQHDLDLFRKETKEASPETASRNFIKQCYERSYSETSLFGGIFSIDPQYNLDSRSAYAALKAYPRQLVSVANVAPIATTIQSVLQSSELQTVCNLLGWLTNEYLLLEYEDDEASRFSHYCQHLTARLLMDHFWPFADNAFDAEITKSISRSAVVPGALKIPPVTNGFASSNAYPVVKRALELLALYDQAMPKERSQRSSPVIYRIVHETILAVQRAETRLKSTAKATFPDPDPDLFMVKNLLILKNELVSLEFGDIRSGSQVAAMQHFSQIWDTLSPQNWMSLFSGILGGTLSLGLWSSTPTTTGANIKTTSAAVRAPAEQDASEKLDELLRHHIVAFTQRWGGMINGARSGKRGGGRLESIEKELDQRLQTAFGGQPEVVGKLKEAIAINAEARKEAGGTGAR